MSLAINEPKKHVKMLDVDVNKQLNIPDIYNNIIRTGTVAEGSCFFHSVLKALNLDGYSKMDERNKLKYMKDLRNKLSDSITINQYKNNLINISSLRLSIELNNFLGTLYDFVENPILYFTNCKESAEFLGGIFEDNIKVFKLINSVLEKNDFKNIINNPKITSSNDIDIYIKNFGTVLYDLLVKEINEVGANVPQDKLDICKIQINKFSKNMFNFIVNDQFEKYKEELKRTNEWASDVMFGLLADYLNIDIYFININDKKVIAYDHVSKGDRPSVVVGWINDSHFENIGVNEDSGIRRLFDPNHPFILSIKEKIDQEKKKIVTQVEDIKEKSPSVVIPKPPNWGEMPTNEEPDYSIQVNLPQIKLKNSEKKKLKITEESDIEDIKDMQNKLSDKYRNEISWNGYQSDIMKSGLQKYIRRGNLEKALYCAGELDLFKEAPNRGETIRTNFIHRLMIIYMEDVENMSIFKDVNSLITKLFSEREKSTRNKKYEEELLSRLVYLLTVSEKARVCYHIRAVFNPKYNNSKLLDKYPSIKELWDEINKNKSKTLESHCAFFKKYFKEKNILCVYYAFQIDLSEEKLKVKYFRSNKAVYFIFNELLSSSKNKERINSFVEWYKDHIGKMKEGFLCWLFPLLYEIGVIPPGTHVDIKEMKDIPLTWDKNREMKKIKIDDYVIDKHTQKGRGKDLVDFAICGALVYNEASFVNKLWKKFYNDGKRYEENYPIVGEFGEEKICDQESDEKEQIKDLNIGTWAEMKSSDEQLNFPSIPKNKKVKKKITDKDYDEEEELTKSELEEIGLGDESESDESEYYSDTEESDDDSDDDSDEYELSDLEEEVIKKKSRIF
jgi:hypothetical protein